MKPFLNSALDYIGVLGQYLVMVLIVAGALLIYDKKFKSPIFGTVDIAQVMRDKSAQLEQALARQYAAATQSPDSVKTILTATRIEAEKFAQLLPMLLNDISVDCKCVVLASNAVASASGITPRPLDLTPALRTKAGL